MHNFTPASLASSCVAVGRPLCPAAARACLHAHLLNGFLQPGSSPFPPQLQKKAHDHTNTPCAHVPYAQVSRLRDPRPRASPGSPAVSWLYVVCQTDVSERVAAEQRLAALLAAQKKLLADILPEQVGTGFRFRFCSGEYGAARMF